jgi:ribosomal protein L3 glutamine methyltransferase
LSATTPATVRDWILRAERRLRRARLHYGHGTDHPRDEAAWLVAHAIGVAPARLAARLHRPVTAAQTERVRALVGARIATRQPLAYLLREAWLAGLRFYVDERVLVPRSLLAEFIGERFRPWIEPARVRRVLDLGTGSGCLAIACARAFPRARVDAVDVSAAALAVARINVRRHRLARRLRLIRSDLFERLSGRRYDLIVSNPPYVSAREMKRLPAEYRHEPPLALAAGREGLDVLTRILAEAGRRLNPGGLLVAETGASRAALARRFPRLPFVWLASAGGDESVFLLAAEALARPAALSRHPRPSRARRSGRR